jgi:hypothetical protein
MEQKFAGVETEVILNSVKIQLKALEDLPRTSADTKSAILELQALKHNLELELQKDSEYKDSVKMAM